jgi:hypothetical protein
MLGGALSAILLGSAAMADPGRDPEPAAGPLGPGKLTWVVTAKALQLMRAVPGAAGIVERFFDDSRTYVVVSPAQLDEVPAKAKAVMGFSSQAQIAAALAAGPPDPRYAGVLYDCEAWDFTPVEEQRAPGAFHRRAAALVHAKGLTFLAAPATTLRKVVLPPVREGVWPGFLATGIIPDAAAEADLFVIQAQGIAGDIDRYVDLVAGGAMQARRHNPGVVVLGGLSTRPSGRDLTVDQLLLAIVRTRNVVAGYWLNIPSDPAYCPDCGEPRPEVAVDLLRRMEAFRPPERASRR